MNSGQHHLTISVCGQCLYLPHNLFLFSAPYSSPCIRDNAVRTKLITAILHFQIGSCMLCRPCEGQFFVLCSMVDIDYFNLLMLLFLCKIGIQDPDQLLFLIIPNDNINILILFPCIGPCLHITARSHDHRIRILLSGTMDHLSGFPVCNIRNRTGINDINIRLILERDNLISVLLKKFLHCFRLIGIYFTPQIV